MGSRLCRLEGAGIDGFTALLLLPSILNVGTLRRLRECSEVLRTRVLPHGIVQFQGV